MLIKVKNYEHYNRSLGKYITSKASYEKEMARQGMISYEKGCEIAEKARKEQVKPYKISKKAQEVINTVKNSADKHGKVKLCDRTIDVMKEMGVSFDRTHCPSHYEPKGGWNAV